MNFILFDDFSRNHLLPLTFTRPVADIRVGILTIREKWEYFLKTKTSTLTETYLAVKYPIKKERDTILINGSILPDTNLVKQILKLSENESLVCSEKTIALRVDVSKLEYSTDFGNENTKAIEWNKPVEKIEYPWDIFSKNKVFLEADFGLLTKRRKSQKPDSSNTIIGKGKIFIGEGAKIYGATLNAATGPIYIGKETEVMEGSMIRGPFALCDHSTLKMGAKIYGPTTIGPHCKVGGELNNVVFLGYSNKAHDGFLGNSVIGEWCNLGADTNSSNLKNTYDEVRVWNYPNKSFIPTGLQFCGLIMGDHSKCGINTMFNTGTVVGVSSNIFGSGFQRNFIPSFMWGGTSGFKTYDLKKAMTVASRVLHRRDKEFTDADKKIFQHILSLSQ
ncbi:MAG: GlmU family protein [Bacteroidales bacterium]|nr:GlmU family protein [Bacteroidales bacterium]